MPAKDLLLRPFRAFRGAHRAHQPSAEADACETPASPVQGAGETEITLNHVWTDQPNAIKLQVSRLLVPIGETREYLSPDGAGESPLARALFEQGGIDAVTFEGSYVTVFMHEDADWEALMERVPHGIAKFLKAGGEVVEGLSPERPTRKYSFGFRQVTARPREEQLKIVQELLENEVNPAVAAHGGHFTLVDVKDNQVYVQLGGGCQGCGMANVTLRQGVEERIKQALPEMVALVDVTDHAAGTNPYYQAGKK